MFYPKSQCIKILPSLEKFSGQLNEREPAKQEVSDVVVRSNEAQKPQKGEVIAHYNTYQDEPAVAASITPSPSAANHPVSPLQASLQLLKPLSIDDIKAALLAGGLHTLNPDAAFSGWTHVRQYTKKEDGVRSRLAYLYILCQPAALLLLKNNPGRSQLSVATMLQYFYWHRNRPYRLQLLSFVHISEQRFIMQPELFALDISGPGQFSNLFKTKINNNAIGYSGNPLIRPYCDPASSKSTEVINVTYFEQVLEALRSGTCDQLNLDSVFSGWVHSIPHLSRLEIRVYSLVLTYILFYSVGKFPSTTKSISGSAHGFHPAGGTRNPRFIVNELEFLVINRFFVKQGKFASWVSLALETAPYRPEFSHKILRQRALESLQLWFRRHPTRTLHDMIHDFESDLVVMRYNAEERWIGVILNRGNTERSKRIEQAFAPRSDQMAIATKEMAVEILQGEVLKEASPRTWEEVRDILSLDFEQRKGSISGMQRQAEDKRQELALNIKAFEGSLQDLKHTPQELEDDIQELNYDLQDVEDDKRMKQIGSAGDVAHSTIEVLSSWFAENPSSNVRHAAQSFLLMKCDLKNEHGIVASRARRQRSRAEKSGLLIFDRKSAAALHRLKAKISDTHRALKMLEREIMRGRGTDTWTKLKIRLAWTPRKLEQSLDGSREALFLPNSQLAGEPYFRPVLSAAAQISDPTPLPSSMPIQALPCLPYEVQHSFFRGFLDDFKQVIFRYGDCNVSGFRKLMEAQNWNCPQALDLTDFTRMIYQQPIVLEVLPEKARSDLLDFFRSRRGSLRTLLQIRNAYAHHNQNLSTYRIRKWLLDLQNFASDMNSQSLSRRLEQAITEIANFESQYAERIMNGYHTASKEWRKLQHEQDELDKYVENQKKKWPHGLGKPLEIKIENQRQEFNNRQDELVRRQAQENRTTAKELSQSLMSQALELEMQRLIHARSNLESWSFRGVESADLVGSSPACEVNSSLEVGVNNRVDVFEQLNTSQPIKVEQLRSPPPPKVQHTKMQKASLIAESETEIAAKEFEILAPFLSPNIRESAGDENWPPGPMPRDEDFAQQPSYIEPPIKGQSLRQTEIEGSNLHSKVRKGIYGRDALRPSVLQNARETLDGHTAEDLDSEHAKAPKTSEFTSPQGISDASLGSAYSRRYAKRKLTKIVGIEARERPRSNKTLTQTKSKRLPSHTPVSPYHLAFGESALVSDKHDEISTTSGQEPKDIENLKSVMDKTNTSLRANRPHATRRQHLRGSGLASAFPNTFPNANNPKRTQHISRKSTYDSVERDDDRQT
ncbi:hypothetical protein N0V90_012083 [Kalmusia sp. IMI 367209]|nr:hypothetical protein N0V90_012083 [Kalmusia sp. IMI 367209]